MTARKRVVQSDAQKKVPLGAVKQDRIVCVNGHYGVKLGSSPLSAIVDVLPRAVIQK